MDGYLRFNIHLKMRKSCKNNHKTILPFESLQKNLYSFYMSGFSLETMYGSMFIVIEINQKNMNFLLSHQFSHEQVNMGSAAE